MQITARGVYRIGIWSVPERRVRSWRRFEVRDLFSAKDCYVVYGALKGTEFRAESPIGVRLVTVPEHPAAFPILPEAQALEVWQFSWILKGSPLVLFPLSNTSESLPVINFSSAVLPSIWDGDRRDNAKDKAVLAALTIVDVYRYWVSHQYVMPPNIRDEIGATKNRGMANGAGLR